MSRKPVTRREFLASQAAAGFALLSAPVNAAGIAEQYAGLKSDEFFAGPLQTEAQVVDQKVFLEGPTVSPDGRIVFSNSYAAKTLVWNPGTRNLSAYQAYSWGAKGLLFDHAGWLLACESKSGRVTRTNLVTREVTVLADQFGGHPLGLPNDLTIDRLGRVYFTSRFQDTAPKTHNVNSVYRIDPDGKVSRILHEPDIHMPNGLAIAPDGRTFYLIEADGREKRNRRILAYDLKEDGSVVNARRIIDFYPGRGGHGMCVDEEGNLYVAAGLHKTRGTHETLDTRPGIHVISPKGALLAYLATPIDILTKCTFGGADRKTLYITCGDLLLSARTQRAGPKPML